MLVLIKLLSYPRIPSIYRGDITFPLKKETFAPVVPSQTLTLLLNTRSSHVVILFPPARRLPLFLWCHLRSRAPDNLAANYSRELADYIIYVIDVAGGDKVPRKGGPGITQSDLLIINKTDLAEAVGADLEVRMLDRPTPQRS